MNETMKLAMFVAAAVYAVGSGAAYAQHDHGRGGHGHGEEAGHSHERAEAHGGAVTMSKEFHVETVFLPDQVRLYLYDSSQNPMHVKHWEKGLVKATGMVEYRDRARGSTTLTFVRGAPGDYACPMCAGQESSKPGKCPKCGMNLVKQDIPDGTLWSCPMHPDENGKAPGKCGDCGMKFMPQDYLVAPVDLSGLKDGEARFTFTLSNLPGTNERMLRFSEKLAFAKMGKQEMDKHKMEHGKGEHGDHDHGH